MSSESGSVVPVSEATQESKDELLQSRRSEPPRRPGNRDHVASPAHKAMVSGSEVLLLNGQDLARMWDQLDSMKTTIEELRSKSEENNTVARAVEKLCDSIDRLGFGLGSKVEIKSQPEETAMPGSHDSLRDSPRDSAYPEVSIRH